MTNLATRVAASVRSAAVQAQSRAVCLDMTEALAVIALLSCCKLVAERRELEHGDAYSQASLGLGKHSTHGLSRISTRISFGMFATPPTWLLAVVAKPFTRRANLSIVSNIAALVAGPTSKRRHDALLIDLRHRTRLAAMWLEYSRARSLNAPSNPPRCL